MDKTLEFLSKFREILEIPKTEVIRLVGLSNLLLEISNEIDPFKQSLQEVQLLNSNLDMKMWKKWTQEERENVMANHVLEI